MMASSYSKLGLVSMAFYLCEVIADDNELSLSPTKNQILAVNSKINLDNLFQPEIRKSKSVPEVPGASDTDLQSIQLVGTLILGNKKLAWIKVASSTAYELMQGESIPGSALRVGRINPDSVEIIKIGNCVVGKSCREWLSFNEFQD